MKIELEKLLRKPVDLVSSNGLSPLVKPFIEKNKLLIYEATEA
jgi:predicted nucleotidyltransferase